MSRASIVVFTLLVVAVSTVSAFYLPGIAPHEFTLGKAVRLQVNKLDSTKTQMPYDYYHLPWTKNCKPSKIEVETENLGEILAGDRIETSLYQLSMNVREACKVLCRTTPLNKNQLSEWRDRINEEYRVNWIVDNLPAATKFLYQTEQTADGKPPTVYVHYEKGFPLGFTDPHDSKKKYINNHVRMNLLIHEHHAPTDTSPDPKYRIVGFEVEAFSVAHKAVGAWDEHNMSNNRVSTCNAQKLVDHTMPHQIIDPKAPGTQIIFSYDVEWTPSMTKWASRWDIYLDNHNDAQIHWFSIVNSIMIVLFLTGMIAMIMLRTLRRDLVMYNELLEADEENAQEETGWKLIYGDVFRPPRFGGTFSIFVGTGIQLLFMTVVTLVFAVLGFLSPANRGAFMTALLLFYVFMGFFAGYASTRVYKLFKMVDWRTNTMLTALFFPGVCFALFFILDLVLWHYESTAAVPFLTLVALLILWFGISVPLVYFGSYFAFKKPAPEVPVTVNDIPRMIPEQPWYMQNKFSILMGGILPFGAVFIEVYFIMTSMWMHQFYYLFTFLFVVCIILAITCAEIAIVMIYFQLCGEDYHWWWRSFLTAGSSAVYLFLYSIMYFYTRLEIVYFLPGLIYFIYMGIVSIAFFIMTGTIGFLASYWFVHKIYSSIKVD